MADITITAAEVTAGTSGTTEALIALEAIDAGEFVYKSGVSCGLADADNTAKDTLYGIAVGSALTGQMVVIQRSGDVFVGATAAIVAGTQFILSDTAGVMETAAVPSSTQAVCYVGTASATANTLTLAINNTGIITG